MSIFSLKDGNLPLELYSKAQTFMVKLPEDFNDKYRLLGMIFFCLNPIM